LAAVDAQGRRVLTLEIEKALVAVYGLAGIDLHSGHIFGNLEHRHRNIEFIC
jgi:hypothetical protein